MEKKKIGRPRKAKKDLKICTSIRLTKEQIKIISLYGNSKQHGIDFLIQWAKENNTLIN